MLVNMFKLTGHTNIDHPFTYIISVLKIAYEQNYNPLQKILRKIKKSRQRKFDVVRQLLCKVCYARYQVPFYL